MKEVCAVSGSNGFIGKKLLQRLEQPYQLGRDGLVPNNINVVFDLACFGNMAEHTGTKQIYKANLMRVIDSLECLSDEQKFLYVSTSSVMLPTQTPYSLSKKAAEEYLRITDKKVAIVRPYTVVGIGEGDTHLIPTLIRSSLYGFEMPFINEPVHDFIDVDDFVDALITIKDRGRFERELYEIGSGMQHTNQEVRERVEFFTGKKANICMVKSMRNYDSEMWVSNNESISRLGWRPSKTLSHTIEGMVKHERKNT